MTMIRAILCLALASIAMPLAAQEQRSAAPVTKPPLAPIALSAPVVTKHKGVFGGRTLAYTATVEPIVVNGMDDKPAARLVATSYVADGKNAERPVAFVFNGGPIGPTAPLHMGAFGPKRVAIPDDIGADPATFKVVDNIYAPLDAMDIVIFDPANTGYSRTVAGVAPESQFSNVADGRQLAQLIQVWRKLYNRPLSPVYLVGESYGTMRAVEAADQLQKAGDPVAGIVLLGQAVNIIEYAQRPNNIISYAVSLPTLAAVGWAHDKAERKGRSFDQFIKEAQDYGAGEYLTVLFLGDKAPVERKAAVARRLQEFTGLPAEEFLRQRLKVTKTSYQRLLFPGKRLDTNDARYFVPEGNNSASYASRYEPEAARHFRDFLKVPAATGTYSLKNPASDYFQRWDWASNKTPFLDWPYVGQLKSVMEASPKMRLLVVNGYYDTQTTIGAMDYLVSQSGLPLDRVRTRYYEGGHMFYTVEASLKAFTADVRQMVAPVARN